VCRLPAQSCLPRVNVYLPEIRSNLGRKQVLISGRQTFARGSRGSSVSIMSGYRLEDRAVEVRSSAEAKDFSSSLCVQTVSGADPVSCPMGTRGPFSGGKVRPGRDADHSPPFSAGFVNEWMLYILSPLLLDRCVVGLQKKNLVYSQKQTTATRLFYA
jgi:hypothetical protein